MKKTVFSEVSHYVHPLLAWAKLSILTSDSENWIVPHLDREHCRLLEELKMKRYTRNEKDREGEVTD